MVHESTAQVAESIGYSNKYSFDEAFQNALDNLPPIPDPYPDQLVVTRVIAVGSEHGSIVGLNRLYVRLVRLPDAITGSASIDEGEIPFPVGQIPPGLGFPWARLLGGGMPFPLGLSHLAGTVKARRVYSIDHVNVDVLESRPPKFVISACGHANSTGWGPGHLQPIPTKMPPEDGIYDFELVAIPPSGVVGWALTPVVTTRSLAWRPDDGGTVKGIRVFAESNEMTVSVDASREVQPMKSGAFEDGPPGQ